MSEGVKASDVWESGAGRKAKVKEVSSSGRCKIVLLATKVEQTVWTASFVKGRKLVERDGKPFAGYESALLDPSAKVREAKTPKPTPRLGDVWASKTGRIRVRVEQIVGIGSARTLVRWKGVNTSASGTSYSEGFTRPRTLVERDGKAVA